MVRFTGDSSAGCGKRFLDAMSGDVSDTIATVAVSVLSPRPPVGGGASLAALPLMSKECQTGVTVRLWDAGAISMRVFADDRGRASITGADYGTTIRGPTTAGYGDPDHTPG